MTADRNELLNFHRETLVDRLVQLLQESIFSGKYPPKSTISEAGVAKEFGVGRVPAREALLRLEEMNLVCKNHLRREIVKLSREEFRHISEHKIIVEAFAVMKGSLNANQQDFEKIEAILKQMGEQIPIGDLEQRLLLNHAFHDSLVICSGDQRLIQTFLSLARKVRWALPYALRFESNPARGYQRHREIFELFRQREAEKVRRLIETHYGETLDRILARPEFND